MADKAMTGSVLFFFSVVFIYSAHRVLTTHLTRTQICDEVAAMTRCDADREKERDFDGQTARARASHTVNDREAVKQQCK